MKLVRQVRIRALETAEWLVTRNAEQRRRLGLPRVIEPSSTQWFLANREDLASEGLRFTALEDDRILRTPLPPCLNGQPPASWNWAVEWKPKNRFYVELPEGRLVFEPWRCASAVMSAGGSILHDALPIFFHSPDSHPVRNSILLGTPHRLKGRAFLLLNDADSNFYHWMCDILPRLYVAACAGFGTEDFDWFITDQINHDFQRETLAALGVPMEKLFVGPRHRHIVADTLCVTSLYDKSGMVHAESLGFVRDKLLKHFRIDPAPRPGRRIFISRQDGQWRRIENWKAIEPLLKDHGFEILATEHLGVGEQARVLRAASHVIAGHGAGLTNLVFCQPGTRVLEILNDAWGHSMYWLLASKLGLDYTLMKAAASGRHKPELDHMVVDPAPLRAYLEALDA